MFTMRLVFKFFLHRSTLTSSFGSCSPFTSLPHSLLSLFSPLESFSVLRVCMRFSPHNRLQDFILKQCSVRQTKHMYEVCFQSSRWGINSSSFITTTPIRISSSSNNSSQTARAAPWLAANTQVSTWIRAPASLNTNTPSFIATSVTPTTRYDIINRNRFRQPSFSDGRLSSLPTFSSDSLFPPYWK